MGACLGRPAKTALERIPRHVPRWNAFRRSFHFGPRCQYRNLPEPWCLGLAPSLMACTSSLIPLTPTCPDMRRRQPGRCDAPQIFLAFLANRSAILRPIHVPGLFCPAMGQAMPRAARRRTGWVWGKGLGRDPIMAYRIAPLGHVPFETNRNCARVLCFVAISCAQPVPTWPQMHLAFTAALPRQSQACKR